MRAPIIEFVGMPGAGKSTLVRDLRKVLPPVLGPQLPPGSRRASPRLLAAAAGLLLSFQPRYANDIHRLFQIIEAHNLYRRGPPAPMLLEQGLLQRLWAAVVDRRAVREERLQTFLRILAEAPPDVIVHVNTPPAVAATRIFERPRGNSRYDRLARSDILARLGPAQSTYDKLMAAFRDHSRAAILEVSGEDAIAENITRIEAFLRSSLPELWDAR